jgi:hypothetical protein
MASPSHTVGDEELLARLAAAYPVAPCEPDLSALQHLSVAVAAMRPTAAPPVPLPRRAGDALRARVPRRVGPVVIAGSVLGVLVTGTGISYAVGVPIPAAVRSVARVVGLAKTPAPSTPSSPPAVVPRTTPTTAVNPAVSAARQAESTLSHALAGRNLASGVISRDSAVLAHRLAEVQGHRAVGAPAATAEGRHLLAQACRQLGDSAPSAVGSAAGGSTPAGTTPPGTTSTGMPCAAARGVVRTSVPTPKNIVAPVPSHPTVTTGTTGGTSGTSGTRGTSGTGGTRGTSDTRGTSGTGSTRGTPTSTLPTGHLGTGTGTIGNPLVPGATTPGLSSGASRVHPFKPPSGGEPTTMTHHRSQAR